MLISEMTTPLIEAARIAVPAPRFATAETEASTATTPAPIVGIVILDYNGLADTLQCLVSLRSVRYNNVSVYVIDNGSAEDDASIVASAFPDVLVHRNADNLGFALGANQGMQLALRDGAEYVLFLNNDAVVQPDSVPKLVDAMERDPNLGICGPAILHSHGRTIQNLGYVYNPWFGWARAVGASRAVGWRPKEPHRIAWLMGCALLCRRSLLVQTGGFDADFFLYWEDHHLCWKAKQIGFSIAVVPDATVLHRKTVGSEFSKRHVYHMFLGQITFVAKTAKWWQKPTLSLGMCAVALAYALLGLARRGSFVVPVIWQAVADFYTGHPKRHVIFDSLRHRVKDTLFRLLGKRFL